jgi:O-antigen/teichoic acid export membrane protein
MWLSAVAGVAYTSGDRIIVGRVLGAAAAGRYNIYVQLTQIIHFVPSSLFAFSLPAFSRLSAREGTRFEICRAYKTYLFIVCAIALGLTVILLTLWPFLLRSVTGNHAPSGGPDAATQLLAGNFLLLALSVIPYYLLLAHGRSRVVSMTTSSSMLVTLLLMTVLIPRFGLQGAAAARLAYGIGSLGLFVGAHRLMKRA